MIYAAFDRLLARLALAAEEPVGIGVSAGGDSMALWFLAIKRLGPARVRAFHVDHRVRPDSQEDARFLREVAVARGWSLEVTALAPGPADEARLREARLSALDALRAAAGVRWVLLGHHRDDQAETVLMQIIRHGVPKGMPALRPPFARPWLRVPRAHVARFRATQRIPWREDPSNRDPRYVRNRVRRELMPLLERVYRPGIARRLAALAEPMAPRGLRPGGAGITVQRQPFAGQVPSRHRVLFDADRVGPPTVRLARPDDRIAAVHRVAERGNETAARGLEFAPWVVVEPQRVLWIPGVARSSFGAPGATTREVWIFESK
jgi:tRNA(Ile)-lysidine synthetase-like protein